MNKINVIVSISIGTLVYVLISLFCGQNGLWAESQLAQQKKELCNNLYTIQILHDELQLEYSALTKDKDVIASYARKLGFVNEGEHLIKITGIESKSLKSYSIGKYYTRNNIQYVPEWICKLLGYSVFVLCLIISCLLVLSEKTKKVQLREVINGNF